jgi:hypothetical protein
MQTLNLFDRFEEYQSFTPALQVIPVVAERLRRTTQQSLA